MGDDCFSFQPGPIYLHSLHAQKSITEVIFMRYCSHLQSVSLLALQEKRPLGQSLVSVFGYHKNSRKHKMCCDT